MKSLKTKLLAFFLTIGLLPLVCVGILSYNKAHSALIKKTGEEMSSQALHTIDKIDRNLFERYGDVQAFAHYAAKVQTKEEMTNSINLLTKNYGCYDLMLIVDMDGTVVNANTVDYQGRPISTSWLLGKRVTDQAWFQAIRNGNVRLGESYYTDVEENPWIAQIYGTKGHSLHFSAPIFDENGNIVKIWANWASRERIIGEIVTEQRANLESRGMKGIETQLLNKEGVVIDDYDPNAILKFNLAGAGLKAAQDVIKGKDGYNIEHHARKKTKYINGYAHSRGALGFAGYKWSMLVREDYNDAVKVAATIRNFIVVIGLIFAAIICVVAFWIANSITKPMADTVDVLEALAEGDMTQTIDVRTEDEVGRMGEAINKAVKGLGQFILKIKENAARLSTSGDEMSNVSRQMTSTAETASVQANNASASAEQVSKNVQTVATSTEEMTASVKEIAKNASQAATVATEAVTVANSTNSTVAKLGDSSNEIGQVIKVITSIAQQTNLLALNATIEAARAGEAGKGFAVVANEVKELAKETAKATEEIGQKIEAIQTDTKGAVSAIGQIGSVINQINDISNTIASAVEEQLATTNEISRNVSEAAGGTGQIALSISNVAKAATDTTAGCGNTSRASNELAQLAEELGTLVDKFKVDGAATESSSRPVTVLRAA